MKINNSINYKSISEELNLIFKNIDFSIRTSIEKKFNIKTRKTKVNYDSTLLYSLLYTENGVTKNEIINNLNLFEQENNKQNDELIIYNRTTLCEKESKIPINNYYELLNKVTQLYLKYFSNEKLEKIVAVDGCYNNTNIYNIKNFLETSLNMGFYDVTNDIPLELSFNGIKDKNNEVKLLSNYIELNKDKLTNIIFVIDRAYCSYKFVNLLNKYKIKYVIRFRNNCKNFNKIDKTNYRIINKTISITEIVPNLQIDNYTLDSKKFNSVTTVFTDEYKIITNLDESYSNEQILEIYNKRWSVEIF
jgi:hypothetical protein